MRERNGEETTCGRGSREGESLEKAVVTEYVVEQDRKGQGKARQVPPLYRNDTGVKLNNTEDYLITCFKKSKSILKIISKLSPFYIETGSVFLSFAFASSSNMTW